MKFSEKLKKLRQEKNLTQDDLAEKIFVTRTAVSKWETDNGYPSIESLKLLAKLFSTTIDDLISEEDIKIKEDLELKNSKINHYISLGGLGIAVVCAICLYFIKNAILFGVVTALAILGACLYFTFTQLSLTYYKDKKLSKKQIAYNKFREVLSAVLIFLVLFAVVRNI